MGRSGGGGHVVAAAWRHGAIFWVGSVALAGKLSASTRRLDDLSLPVARRKLLRGMGQCHAWARSVR